MTDAETYTRDSISLRGSGVVTLSQPKKGHRFTLDSLLLADFCRIKSKERILEPGAGTGIISLLLARKHPRCLYYPVEINKALVDLCERNINENGLRGKVIAVKRDIRTLYRSFSPCGFDVIVANPPYTRAETGKNSPFPERQAARKDMLGEIESWLDLHKFLRQGGRYNIVFTAARMAELLSLMRERRIEPKRLRLIHPFTGKPASIVLIEAIKQGGASINVLPPLFVHEADGSYTEEMRAIYGLP